MNERERSTARRLIQIRAELVRDMPFYGRLLLHLKLGLSDCETAYTDGTRLVFDPAFVEKLPDISLKFLMLHELYHCILNHISRGKGKIHTIYNVACDIVVNSLILDSFNMKEINVGGTNAMHIAPDGNEGKLYSAEEVYRQLMSKFGLNLDEALSNLIDAHDVWETVEGILLENLWKQRISKASKECGDGSGIPYGLKRYLKDISHNPKCNWRQILHDYIRHNRGDYLFTPPDKRFSDSNVILPSFVEDVDGEKVEKLWFLIDTSGSMSEEAVSESFYEIRDAVSMIGCLSGWLSFFDIDVSSPVEFDTVEALDAIEPIGGGGTSFARIFEVMPDYYKEDLPSHIIIMTDGYAPFPEESAAKNVPVLWIIVDSDIEPAWGEVIHIDT